MMYLAGFLLLASPFAGSFLAASANAWPDHAAMLKLRSSCSHCGHQLTAWENLPIISFILLRGQCRQCRAAIGWPALLAELLAMAVAVCAVLLADGWHMFAICALGWTLLFASLVDARTRLLPDGSTLGLIPAGLLVQFGLAGWNGVMMGAMGAALGFGVLWAVSMLYRKLRGRDGLGLGDAKLLAAGGAWCGPFAVSWIVLLGAGLALVCLILPRPGKKPLSATTSIAFGPALAAGIFIVFLARFVPLLHIGFLAPEI